MCSQYTIFSLPNCIQSVLTGTCERCCCAISAGEDCLSIVCFIKCALRPRGMFRAAEKGASLAAAWLLREGASGLPRAPSRDGRMGRLPPPCGEGEAVGGGAQPLLPGELSRGYRCYPARAMSMPAPSPRCGDGSTGPGQWLEGGSVGTRVVGSGWAAAAGAPGPSALLPSCCLPHSTERSRAGAWHCGLGVARAGFCSRSVGPQHRPGLS